MFIVTQFIGLYVVNYYSPAEQTLPYGLDVPDVSQTGEYGAYFTSIIFAFILAILLFALLTKFDLSIVLKIWFFVVVWIALGLAINTIIPSNKFAPILALIFSLPLVLSKLYKRNLIVHNITELLIYPGVAAVFVPILNVTTLIVLLIIISVYDMWAVWKSKLMQKMVKYQIKKLKMFSGFFIPHVSKTVRAKMKKMTKAQMRKKNFKVNVAVLGGGDVIFPIIASGIMLKFWGLGPALLTMLGATLGLSYLFFFAEKKKYYPAMPFISAGIFLGMIVSYYLF